MKLKHKLINTFSFCSLLILKLINEFLYKIKLTLFYQNREVINFLSDPDSTPTKKHKVLVTISHITSAEEASDEQRAAIKTKRLKNTLDNLFNSFSHCDLQIVICTVPGRHITSYLPQYQQEAISVYEAENKDPMYIGYTAQDILASQVDHFEWFLFIEDDIIIYDSWFLQKIEAFNRLSGRKNALLFPNRYEMYNTRKSYIDLTIDVEVAWNKVSSIEINGVRFSECTNSHAGLYCLSQAQMQYWINSGRHWKDRSIMVGPLESAATYCLFECFSIYKPHPTNLNYLEVRHFDTKYSKMFPPPSPYILSAVSESPAISINLAKSTK